LGRDLHLILEAHVALDVLAGHADVVCDLVDLVALLGACQDAAQAVDGRMVRVVGLDVPIVLLDLGGNPFFPAATYLPAFRGVGKPATPTRAPAISGVLRALRRIKVEVFAEAIDRSASVNS
jgi:hypothetical protein